MGRLRPERVLVAGATGQLGAAIVEAFADRTVIAHGSATLDLTDAAAVQAAVTAARPDAIVNCAAFNDVDGAERRPREALALNAFGVRSLARAAEDAGARLVHYSTDFVFDGAARTPYREIDPPSPRSTYAASKLLGEWLALDAPDALVLRVESLFGTRREWTGRRGTLETIVDGLEAGRELTVFTDRVVSPSYIVDIAAATRYLLDHGADGGLYHCVNSGSATWEVVSREAARVLGTEPHLRPVRMADVTFAAARPLYCALDNRKLADAGFAMPAWQDALARWLSARAR
jgi:dTDP-4-dehydrorhamnose reductase